MYCRTQTRTGNKQAEDGGRYERGSENIGGPLFGKKKCLVVKLEGVQRGKNVLKQE